MGASPAARQRNADGLYGGHGEVAIRRLKAQSARAAEPQRSAASRAAVPLLAVMRARNWVTGLAVPIVAAIAVGIALVIVVGANGGTGGSAPSTLSAGFPPARDASADFTGTPALAGRGLSQSLSQVAVSGTTAVALGAQSGTPAPLARFFVSTNSGQTWRLATVRGTSAGGSPSLVAGGPHGWMAVGTGTTFVSPNGSSWLPSAPLPQQPGDTVTTLTATASGFLAAGENVPGGDNGQATPVVWLSANGTSWQRLSGAALPLTAPAGRVGGITHTASSGNAVVITATAGGGSAVWRSADGGKTWAPVTIPAAAGESASIAGLAPLKAGFVAVRGAAGATQAAVYASADGMAWRRTATLATASGAALTLGLTSGGPAGAVVTGEADGLVIAFLSPDGVTWTGTDPVNTTGPEQVSGAALTGGGQALIAGAAGGKAALTAIGAHGAPDHVNLSAIPGANVAEVAVNAVASSAGDQVAAGSADGFPALWTSQDGGSTWARATGATQAVLGRQGENQLSSVTHGAAGWLAVGGALTAVGSGTGSASGGDSGIGDTGTAGPPVVVGSADGKTWMAADRETAFAGSGMVTSAAAAGPAGYVVVGRQVSGGQAIAAAWYSRGLTGWRRATDAQAGALDGGGNRQMNAVTAAAKGFVAVGSTGTRPAAWLSASGRTWSAIAVPAPAGAARAELRYVAANGNTVAADGVATTAAGQRIPFAAVSVNGGATWSQTLLPVPKGGAGSVTALAAAGGGFTATGTYGQPGAQDVVVWLLSEGAAPTSAWTAATPEGTGLAGPGTQAITALTGSGATLTGVGFAATAGAEEPTIWQSPVRG